MDVIYVVYNVLQRYFVVAHRPALIRPVNPKKCYLYPRKYFCSCQGDVERLKSSSTYLTI